MVFSAAYGIVEAPHRLPSKPGALQGLSTPREFWYEDVVRDIVEDEATHELREVLGHNGGQFPKWMPAFGTPGGCSSAGSTAATASRLGTPPPPATSPPNSDCSEAAAFDGSDESPAHCQAGRNSFKSSSPQDKEFWKQSRKVFVGGIPQSIDQNGFYELFNQIGKLEKAWLQWQHDSEGRPMQKHRGFGFVIFRDSRSLDYLLGQEMSRYVWFGNSLKLEVKRAFGKTDVSYSTAHSDFQKGRTTPKPIQRYGTPGLSSPSSAQSWQPQQQVQQQGLSSPSSAQSWQPQQQVQQQQHPSLVDNSSSPTSSKSWQSHSWLYTNSSLPGVPPFPCMESNVMEPSQSRGTSMSISPSPHVSHPSPPPAVSHTASMTNAVLAGFVGQQPLCRQELEQMLQAAVPDHYDD